MMTGWPGDGARRDAGDQAGQQILPAGVRLGGEQRERRGEDARVQHAGGERLPGPASTSAVSASRDLPRALLSSSRPVSMPATVHASPS